MALYSYQKSPVTKKRTNVHRIYKPKVVLNLQNEPLTLWRLVNGFVNDIKEILTTSRLAGTIIPAILIIFGFNLLWQQIIPVIVEKLQKDMGYFDQGTVSLVKGDYVMAKQEYLSNPGSQYFTQLQNSARKTNVLQYDEVSAAYKGTFKLSIPNLGLYDLPVQANAESGDEKDYDRVLSRGLAHMQSTGLPISSIKNNIVIYGHSAGGDYYKRTGDKVAAFSQLEGIKLGDEINLTIDGKEYDYKVMKTKIVKPDDVTIITGDNSYAQTLTLFTCHPNGNNANRLVVIANPVRK